MDKVCLFQLLKYKLQTYLKLILILFSRGVGLLIISLLFLKEGTESGEVRNVKREKSGRREMLEWSPCIVSSKGKRYISLPIFHYSLDLYKYYLLIFGFFWRHSQHLSSAVCAKQFARLKRINSLWVFFPFPISLQGNEEKSGYHDTFTYLFSIRHNVNLPIPRNCPNQSEIDSHFEILPNILFGRGMFMYL